MSRRTATRRWSEPAFRQQVVVLRAALLERAAAQLADAASEAVSTLRTLLQNPLPSARLGAARAILEFATSYQASVELEARLRELEARVGTNSGHVVEGTA
jgi:hypothetical protein